MVQECLPAFGQSWATFLCGKEEKFHYSSDLESDSSTLLFQVPEDKLSEALGCLQMLVRSFLDDLEQIDSSIFDATRGDTGISTVPKFKLTSKIKVYYATDRRVTADGEYTAYRSERGNLHYGYVVVGVPGGDRKPGEKAAPGTSEEADPLKHIVIYTIQTLLPGSTDRGDKEAFVRNLREALYSKSEAGASQAQSSANALLLYIHGFNTLHKSAVKTAARLKHDLGFKGQVIVYCWSSYGSKYSYCHDEQQIRKTVANLEDFIKTIMNMPGNPDVHIIAHSMGNRALIKALCNIHDALQPTLKNVVFAAADEARGRFDDMVRKLQTSGNQGANHEQHNKEKMKNVRSDMIPYIPQFTVYSSTDDPALGLSKVVHMKDRLGNTYSFLDKQKQEKGSDQVDVSGPKITKSWLHHSYHVEVPAVLKDIGHLLLTNENASHRSRRPNPSIKRVTQESDGVFRLRRRQMEVWSVPLFLLKLMTEVFWNLAHVVHVSALLLVDLNRMQLIDGGEEKGLQLPPGS